MEWSRFKSLFRRKGFTLGNLSKVYFRYFRCCYWCSSFKVRLRMHGVHSNLWNTMIPSEYPRAHPSDLSSTRIQKSCRISIRYQQECSIQILIHNLRSQIQVREAYNNDSLTAFKSALQKLDAVNHLWIIYSQIKSFKVI